MKELIRNIAVVVASFIGLSIISLAPLIAHHMGYL